MLQSPPLASMLPFHHAMQVAAAQVRPFYFLPAFQRPTSTKRPQSSGVDLGVRHGTNFEDF